VLLPFMKRTLTITLDVDWLWRKALPWTWERGASAAAAIADGVCRP